MRRSASSTLQFHWDSWFLGTKPEMFLPPLSPLSWGVPAPSSLPLLWTERDRSGCLSALNWSDGRQAERSAGGANGNRWTIH